MLKAVDETIAAGTRVKRLGIVKHEMRYATRSTLKLEARLIKEAGALKAKLGHGIAASSVDRVLERYSSQRSAVIAELRHHGKQLLNASRDKATQRVDRATLRDNAARVLSDEQAAAVRHLTGERRGDIRILEGLAGTGKTSALFVAREIWENAGYRVVGVALPGKARRELEKGAGIESYTVAKFSHMIQPSIRSVLENESFQLKRALVGKGRADPPKFKIDSKTVLVVDEAAMLSTAAMERLVRTVKKAGAMLVLAGDRLQTQAIDPADRSAIWRTHTES
jgi:ATP-dependent exoDNAse (exonuclease V) alpha subunit